MTRIQLARALVRLYPRAWRARYEGELLDLLRDEPPGARAVIDIAVAAATERVHSPAVWRPGARTRLTAAGMVEMFALGVVGGVTALLGVPVAAWLAGRGVALVGAWWLMLPGLLVPLRGFLGSFAVRHGDDWDWASIGKVELAVWLAITLSTSAASGLPHSTLSGLSTPASQLSLWMVFVRGTNVLILSLGTRRQIVRQRRIAALRADAVARRRSAVGLD